MRKEALICSVIFAVFALLLVQAASAEIILGQTKSSYSFGDTISLSISVKTTAASDDFLNVRLICDQGEKTVLYVPLTLAAGEQKDIMSNISLTKSFLGNLTGNCEINAAYNGDEQSQSFTISDALLVEMNVAKSDIQAGDSVPVAGEAKESDGSPVNGYIDLTVEGTAINVRAQVTNGEFSSNIVFPDDIKAGTYTLTGVAYEKDKNGAIQNSGEASSVIVVGQAEKKLEVALTKNSITPPGNITFKVVLYDQSNLETPGTASVKISDAYGDSFFNKILNTGEVTDFELYANSSAGYWSIEASSGNLSAKRLFYVGENEQASFQIVNNTLIITNTGNVIYQKAVEVSIGDTAEMQQVDLDLGESTKLRLLAPDGIYKVSVSDGKTTLNVGDVSLTGNVIGVEDVMIQSNMISRYPIVWLFLVVVLGLFVFLTIEGIKKRGFSISSSKTADKVSGAVIRASSAISGVKNDINLRKETKASLMEKANLLDVVRAGDKIEAEYSLVMKGNKTTSTIISLKLKNANKYSGEVKNRINNVFKELSYKKAAIMETQDFIIIILSPVLTKTFNNEVNGIKIALDLRDALLKYDIDFGIGVNSGDIVGGVERGKLKFTPLGTTLSYAKKVSDLAEKEVLLSKDIHLKTMNEVKTIRADMFGNELYKVDRVTEREKYSTFIAGFKNRQANEDKRAKEQGFRDSINKNQDQ